MDLGVFYEVILPLMEVEGTALICISTPQGSFNFYSELTEIRDDKGKLVFNVRHITGGKVPSWKSEDARLRVKAIYGMRSDTYRQEVLGEIVDAGENAAFLPSKLKEFFKKAPLAPPYTINQRTVFVAIDPNGGASASDGPGSDTAIVSFIISHGRVVVSFVFIFSFLHNTGTRCADRRRACTRCTPRRTRSRTCSNRSRCRRTASLGGARRFSKTSSAHRAV